MTTHRLKRCQHCLVTYSYQSSGYGCFEPTNDDRHCPECRAVILEVLKDVPRRFEKVWKATDEVTFEQLKEWERAWDLEAEERGALQMRRILPGLFDMENPSNKHVLRCVSGRGFFQGKTYTYEYWTTKPDDVKIRVEAEVDLETGDTRPWKNFR